MSDRTEALAEAGFSPHAVGPEQAAVLESLSDEELRVLRSVRNRIDEAASDVQGHTDESSGGGWLW
jgi:hypothetical protein